MARINFPRKVISQAKQRADGRCEKCGGDLKGTGEVDHILPDALGGEPVLANAMVLCRVCHKAKTADDVGRIRKADRQRDKQLGAMKRSARPLKGRRFDKVEKPKKINKAAVDAAAVQNKGGIAARIRG